MLTDPLRKIGAWTALAAGGIEMLAAIALILFFTLEAPQGDAGSFGFGFLSDFLPILAALPALIVVVVLFQALGDDLRPVNALVALLGISGNLILAVTYILFVLEKIRLEGQFAGYLLAMGPLGAWYFLVNTLARKDGLLPMRLTRFGILLGVSQLLTFTIFYSLGGLGRVMTSDLSAFFANPPLLILLAAGSLASLLGYFGPPVWLIGLGRVLANDSGRAVAPAHPQALYEVER